MSVMSFLSGLPALLGIAGFFAYLWIGQSKIGGDIMKGIVSKLRTDPNLDLRAYEGLSPAKLGKMVESDARVRDAVNDQDQKLLRLLIILQHGLTVIVLLVSATLVALSVWLMMRPQPISVVVKPPSAVNKDAEGLLVDLDPLVVEWQSEGVPEPVTVFLENVDTGAQSGKKLHDEREGQIRLIRQQNEGAVRRLSQLFDVVIRELVPGEIEGSVWIDGKGITLKVSQGGERSTAAIESLKVVAFDIAVLILALEGAASLPTFLLHDSPREADLGQSIYDRLFRFIQSLEDKAHFQYIVTTTTEPPTDLSREPWLRATLRGGPPQDRLMGCDL